jgi:probable rRNA maturation factor
VQVIQFVNNFPGFRFFNKTIIAEWLTKIAKTEGKTITNIQYVFCSDAEILEINKSFLKHNYFTDIITFDYSQNNDLEAEIYISIETVRSNALLFHVKPAEELNRVIVHGLLHLIGYDDKTKLKAEEMRKQENLCLGHLNKMIIKHKKSVSRGTKA